MDAVKRMIPIGTDNFRKLRENDYYYVDKTGLIGELLKDRAEVSLFTRPRRFGKTLNMSMLQCFFEIGGASAIFDGLAVSREKELCGKYMGKYPVISLSLKDAVGGQGDSGYALARDMLCGIIGDEALRFHFLLDSERLKKEEKELYRNLIRVNSVPGAKYAMTDALLTGSIQTLSSLLEKHYGQKVIILIDEYDVPLQRAYYGGYYERMAALIRGLFSQGLKTNVSMEFAVLTGCLRVSKESIFTGMNNLKVFTVADVKYDEYFGFTDEEVRALLDYYDLGDAYGRIRQWYDGYRFGQTDMYCPWDVINYCFDMRADEELQPQNYWAHSSGNDAVTEFVRRLDTGSARQELQKLAEGGTVRKEIRQELTYRDMYSTIENLWSLLYMTGYLTARSKPNGRIYELALPNEEIRDIFMDQIMELFREKAGRDGESLRELCSALAAGDAGRVEKSFGGYLRKLISVRDAAARQGSKENFYHGLLLGILSYKADWIVYSNYETGDGYGDILIETEDASLGIVIEVKYVQEGSLNRGTSEALKQIEDRHYVEKLYNDGMEKVLKYGVACQKKQCRVALAE